MPVKRWVQGVRRRESDGLMDKFNGNNTMAFSADRDFEIYRLICIKHYF